jgi:hypothetical protein
MTKAIDSLKEGFMKRINILITGTLVCALILVCALVVWHPSQLSFADETQNVKPATWKHVTFRSEMGKKEDILVLGVWNSSASDPKWPQLALLRLPPAVYKEFRNNTKVFKAFVDGTQTGKPVFDAPVTITEGCKLPEPEDEKSDDVSWLVTLDHRHSLCSCTALLEHTN